MHERGWISLALLLLSLEPGSDRPAALAEGTGELQGLPADAGPSSYNLDEIITEMKNSKTASHAGE